MDLFSQNRSIKISNRDYQEDALISIRDLYDMSTNRTLGVAATGLGKTVIFSQLPKIFPELAEYGMLVLVHRNRRTAIY